MTVGPVSGARMVLEPATADPLSPQQSARASRALNEMATRAMPNQGRR